MVTIKVESQMVKGRVVLNKKNILDVNDVGESVLDRIYELFGQNISFQLISTIHPGNESRGRLKGKIGNPAILEDWITTISNPLIIKDFTYDFNFDWNEEIGLAGAFMVKNNHHSEFFLKTLTLDDVPGHGQVHFVCNSWVYPSKHYTNDRIFFANKAYLPGETPELLRLYREEELAILRGNGSGKLQEWDRVYYYAFYNDLGNPDDVDGARPVLGGSSTYPYPRRGRTGRPSTKAGSSSYNFHPKTKSRLPLLESLSIYVPRDEQFGHVKLSDLLGYNLRFLGQFLVSELHCLIDSTPTEFDSFEDVLKIYEGGIKVHESPLLEKIRKNIPFELLKVVLETDGVGLAKFPIPKVIEADKSAWRTDAEFARQMLAGVNPVSIRLMKEFPPTSKLDVEVYGNQNSYLDGLKIEEAVKSNRLFILDHHDSLMPYVRRINETSSKIYAKRTLLLLQQDGTLKPLAIELSLPHSAGDQFGVISKVYTPAEHGVQGSIWQIAKAYVAVNDAGIHHLISH